MNIVLHNYTSRENLEWEQVKKANLEWEITERELCASIAVKLG